MPWGSEQIVADAERLLGPGHTPWADLYQAAARTDEATAMLEQAGGSEAASLAGYGYASAPAWLAALPFADC